VGRDSEHGGRRLETDGLVKTGFELPKFLVHNDDRRAIIHADDTAKPVIEADDIACTEPEWMLVRHPDNGEKLGLIRVFERTFIAFHGGCSFAANPPGKRWDICRAGQSKCRCETVRTGAAKPAASGSNESQAVKVALSHCVAASAQIEAKPTCRQPGTIPKNAAFRDRASPKLALSGVPGCKTVAENQSDAVVLNCWFLIPTMAGHSPVLTLQFLNVLFS
jgi:hypothetical protein